MRDGERSRGTTGKRETTEDPLDEATTAKIRGIRIILSVCSFKGQSHH